MLSSPAQASRRPSEFRGSHVQPATLFQVPTPEAGFCRILREAARRGRLLGPLVRRRSQGRSRRGEAAASLPAAAPPGFDGPVSAPALQVAAPAARAASCQQEALLQRAQPGSRPSQAFLPSPGATSHLQTPTPTPRREPQAARCPHPVCVWRGGSFETLKKDPSKAPDRSYLHPGLGGIPGKPGSIPAQSGQQRAESRRTLLASRVSTPSRPLGRARQSGQAQVLAGGGGGRGEKRGCDPSSLASYTLLSGPACHWSFDTGPFLVLKTLAALGPGASGSRPLHGGDRTETLMTWAGLQLHLSIKGGGGRLPFSTLLRTHFFGLEGVRDPSSPPRYSLKISGGCFSLSAQLTVHWSHPRAEVDQHPSSEHSIPGSSWSGCNLESAWGSHCLPFLCGLFLPQMWPPQLTQLRACRGEVGGCSFFAFCFCWGL